ncbi:hypothetical protein SAMN04487788_1582 [Microbacterium testaceum StLB037]|uniref:Uncharacterized protein n=1 Tax=Microbacterium testaceum (strain StLB037) TaxID=979556 RepID=A0A1H0NVZ5_MICTS|nr:hypothetical protein [Microbacterium testaceum]SDO96819.1 hypothetical protein SAMN04487788_1582 [Microbacterium testaceum StLB037]
MGTFMRAAGLAVAGLLLAAALGGCAIGGPTGQDRADELANQLENSGLGVRSAKAIFQSSFSGDLSVTVVLSPDVVQPGYTVTAETLGPVLGIVSRSAEEMNVGGVVFYAEDEQGIDVSMVRATEDLGIAEALDGSALLLTPERLETLSRK